MLPILIVPSGVWQKLVILSIHVILVDVVHIIGRLSIAHAKVRHVVVIHKRRFHLYTCYHHYDNDYDAYTLRIYAKDWHITKVKQIR